MKKTNFKYASIILAALICAGTFTGCGSKASDEVYNSKAADRAYNAAQAPSAETNAETNAGAAFKSDEADAVQGGYYEEYPVDESYYNTEEYNYIAENGYSSVMKNPLSTFSVDVDTASYSNLRRMINDGYGLNPDAIRVEEMINYFDYNYPAPKSNEPFSVTTEIADCPWNSETKLMMVGMQAKEMDLSERVPMNLVFLIDVSGSMYDDDKLPLVQKSFNMLTENLDENDRVSIVTYAGSDEVVLQGASGAQKRKITKAINSLSAGGSTAGAAGINTAYEIAQEYFIEGGNNRIILATDGDLNVGISSESELTELIEEKREDGVFLSVLGFGTGNIKDNKMEALADNGNGNYSYIDSESEARKVLVQEMGGTLFTVAKDVKIQVEFNPEYVKGYRLVGYENRALADKDFNDDTKDAGEIGAGHTVTALYEIITTDDYTPELKYQQTEKEEQDNGGIKNGEWLTVSVRYKEPDGDESKLLAYPVTSESYSKEMSEDLTFAAGVAEFGMVLRNSEYKGNATCQRILTMLSDYNYSDDDYKDEFIYLVKTMKNQGY